MSASCLASDRYRRGAVMSLVTPGPSCFSGPAARISSRKLSPWPDDGPCGTTGIPPAPSGPAIGIDVCGRNGTADRPYCCTRSVFVLPLFWIIQKPLPGSMLTVTGSDDIPSAGGAFRDFLSGVFCPPSPETHRGPPPSTPAIARPAGGPIRQLVPSGLTSYSQARSAAEPASPAPPRRASPPRGVPFDARRGLAAVSDPCRSLSSRPLACPPRAG